MRVPFITVCLMVMAALSILTETTTLEKSSSEEETGKEATILRLFALKDALKTTICMARAKSRVKTIFLEVLMSTAANCRGRSNTATICTKVVSKTINFLGKVCLLLRKASMSDSSETEFLMDTGSLLGKMETDIVAVTGEEYEMATESTIMQLTVR